MRQVTLRSLVYRLGRFSKLPVRQVTQADKNSDAVNISKLPVRQVTTKRVRAWLSNLSKLPVRQVTSKKNGGGWKVDF